MVLVLSNSAAVFGGTGTGPPDYSVTSSNSNFCLLHYPKHNGDDFKSNFDNFHSQSRGNGGSTRFELSLFFKLY